MALISLRDVSFTYACADRPALRDVTLDIQAGRLYGIVGANGSGKSTLCHVVRGSIPRFHPGSLSGMLSFRGIDMDRWDAATLSRTIGYVSQNPFTQISGIRDTVFEEIAFGLENLGIAHEEIIERVQRVVTDVGIDAWAAENPNELSGGQRQLVAFAAIMAMDADVIVIDEPTSQLDPEASSTVFDIVGTLRKRGKTILLVEHKMDALAELADDIIAMAHGRIVAMGAARDVFVSGALADGDIGRPEVTELALALGRARKPLAAIPVRYADARDLVDRRLREAAHVDPAE